MTDEGGHGEERRSRTAELIEKLLQERQEVLVLYCRVAGLEPYERDPGIGGLLQEFCQLLVDYVAVGHFELYQRIADGNERRRGVQQLARNVYPGIAETTQQIIDFNDKYDGEVPRELFKDLAMDLSDIGERLAARIELEDQLIVALRPGV